MDFWPSAREALSNLLAAKLRSILALLGVLVGTASVVAMVSCGQLATRQALKQFETLGTDLLAVSVYANEVSTRDLQKTLFTLPVVEGIKSVSSSVVALAPYNTTFVALSFQGKPLRGNVIGATQTLQEVIKINLEEGRFISDLDRYSHYCVIGQGIAKSIRGTTASSLLGAQLWLGNTICTVVGVAAPWQENNFFNENINDAVMIPLQSMGLLTRDATISNIIMTLQKDTEIDLLQSEIQHYIEAKMKGLNIFFRSAKQLIESMRAQSRIFTLLLGMIGSISLLVGGIGIMNIMLVSVTERRKEIGIRMAIGARRRDIQFLFLIESIILSLFGGALGVLLGVVAAFIISTFTHWTFFISPVPVMVGFIVSVMVGIFFGFYPAYKASRLDPIQTLRSE
ncbi:MAG: ABC transporter permease [Gammaproteobacteria bacterium]|nr:ABC transporter permease [Gammaproteobacteria bacterium]